MLTGFCIVASIAFLFMALIWSSKDFINLFIKGLFIILFLWGVVMSLLRFGFGFN